MSSKSLVCRFSGEGKGGCVSVFGFFRTKRDGV